MSYDVEREFQLAADAHEAVDGGGGFDVVVAAINRELPARTQVAPAQRHSRGDGDAARHAVQGQVAADLRLELSAGERAHGDVGAFENYLGILGRLKHYLAQLLVD